MHKSFSVSFYANYFSKIDQCWFGIHTNKGAVPHVSRYGCSVSRIFSLRQRVVECQRVQNHSVVKRANEAVNLRYQVLSLLLIDTGIKR